MNRLTKIRISLLAFLSVGVVLVLAKSLLSSPEKNSQVAPYTFPETVSLSAWKPADSTPIPISKDIDPSTYNSGMQYRYIQNGQPLDIEMRYVNTNSADIKDFLKRYTAIPTTADRFQPITRQKAEIGYYQLFAREGRAYLHSCINPRGNSTVTVEQFRKNRATYDMRVDRVVPWLIGQKELRDNRCLWALLSTPLKNSSPEKAYETLEKAWVSWYQWWQPQFPKP